MEKIDDIKRPVKLGEIFLVPCIVTNSNVLDSTWKYVKGELTLIDNYQKIINPIINHPHTDRENGQNEIHYHLDYRFIKHKNDLKYPNIINKHSKHKFGTTLRPQLGIDGNIEYIELPVINEDFTGITSVELISNSKIKHKCIHKGKCPHRGYDMSQVKSIHGTKTCPLHGLTFDSNSGKLLNR